MFLASLLLALPAAPPGEPELSVKGMTISCRMYGQEWGTDGFCEELDLLRELGVNWVAIHPYASISADGTVHTRFDLEEPPEWIVRPIEEAHRRGMQILVKPHIAYWGSPFDWRGSIDFDEEAARQRFFATYEAWIVSLARAAAAADAFVVGTELDRLVRHQGEWRRIVAAVREVTDAKLTYAANWDQYAAVPFWDALDAIGVQAYFPLVTEAGDVPDEADLERGWTQPLAELRALHERTGKPVVFTELGYDVSTEAAAQPWKGTSRHGRGKKPKAEDGDDEMARGLQERCLTVAFRVLEREREWLRGAFLWKWFVGPAPRADFRMDVPRLHRLMHGAWAQ